MSIHHPTIHEAPVKLDQEWANAVTHGFGTAGALLLSFVLVGASTTIGMKIACSAYMLSVIGTFACSTLSHSIFRQPLLNRLRAWDQAMIYLMISGTYTPIAFRYAADGVRTPLLAALWIAAFAGFYFKVAKQHRVNSVSTISYLMLGWLPAVPLVGTVPWELVQLMIAGGVLYSIGVAILMNDTMFRYAHAVWHIMVMSAAMVHWLGILWYVV